MGGRKSKGRNGGLWRDGGLREEEGWDGREET